MRYEIQFTDHAMQQIVITAAGRPVAVLIGFADEDEWFEYRLLQDPRFKQRIIGVRTCGDGREGQRCND